MVNVDLLCKARYDTNQLWESTLQFSILRDMGFLEKTSTEREKYYLNKLADLHLKIEEISANLESFSKTLFEKD